MFACAAPARRYDSALNSWHVHMATTPTLNRCLPSTSATSEQVRLCAYPTCAQVERPCYTEQFPEAQYWQPAPAELSACEEFVTLATTRTLGPRAASLELEFVSTLFGGFLGTMADVYLGGLELLTFGVGSALLINFVLMFILRHYVRTLFAATVALLFLALGLVDTIALARAGMLHLGWLDPVFSVAAEAEQTGWLIGGYLAVCLSIGVVLVVYLLWSKVDNALEICREATKAVFDNKALITLPLFSTAVSVTLMGHFLMVLVYTLTPDAATITHQLDEITHNLATQTVGLANDAADAAISLSAKAIDEANRLAQQALDRDLLDIQLHDVVIDGGAWANTSVVGAIDPSYVAYSAIVYELFALLWALCFVDAVVYCTIAGAITYWYQEREGKGVGPALYRVLRYHLGSMALGAAVLAGTSAFRYVFMWLDASSKSGRENGLVRLAARCCCCCLWCLDRCVKYLTKFSHVYIAAEGFPFCAAAVKTFTLVSKHPLQMLTNEATLAILSLLLTMLAPLSCAILAYFAVLHEWRASLLVLANLGFEQRGALEWADSVATPERIAELDRSLASTLAGLPDWRITGPPNALTVACATLVVAFWITQMFRMVYAATVDTLFVCMFRDDDFLAGKYSSSAGHSSTSAGASRTASQPGTPAR